VDLLRARYVTHRYAKHSHETYTIALIEEGVEEFEHGRSLLRAGRGAVAQLEGTRCPLEGNRRQATGGLRALGVG
jgi:AraC-like ligand binding domain